MHASCNPSEPTRATEANPDPRMPLARRGDRVPRRSRPGKGKSALGNAAFGALTALKGHYVGTFPKSERLRTVCSEAFLRNTESSGRPTFFGVALGH